MSDIRNTRATTFSGLDHSISGLGLIKYYEAYLVSVVSNKMISDSLRGRGSEEDLASTFTNLIAKEMLENRLWRNLKLTIQEESLIRERSETLSKEVACLIEKLDYKNTSQNKTIAFIREFGEYLVNSVRVLTNSIVQDDEGNETHHIMIQVKNDGGMWIFDMIGDSINYKDVTVYINGVESPTLKDETTLAITSFFKFLAVYKGRDLVLQRKQSKKTALT